MLVYRKFVSVFDGYRLLLFHSRCPASTIIFTFNRTISSVLGLPLQNVCVCVCVCVLMFVVYGCVGVGWVGYGGSYGSRTSCSD